jgi:hypothetical protein
MAGPAPGVREPSPVEHLDRLLAAYGFAGPWDKGQAPLLPPRRSAGQAPVGEREPNRKADCGSSMP